MTERHAIADAADAATLRHAAWVVQERFGRERVALRVLIRVLERMADRIDGGSK